MALPDPVDPPAQLTSLEKFHRFRERDRIDVRLVAPCGREPTWIGARIKATHKGGAHVRTDQGKETFFHWSEIRPPSDPHDPNKPIASLGEIARFTHKEPPRPALRMLSPYLDLEPPAPPLPSSAGQRSPALLISREDLGMPQKKREKHVHEPTLISHLFREQRLKRAWSQQDVADHISSKKVLVTNGRISRIELGKEKPNDDVLLAFAEGFALDLGQLIAARDGSPPPASDVRASLPPPPPASEEVTAISRPEPPAPTPDPTDAFAQFTEDLCAVAPLPMDREKRRDWFRLAVKLYQLVEP